MSAELEGKTTVGIVVEGRSVVWVVLATVAVVWVVVATVEGGAWVLTSLVLVADRWDEGLPEKVELRFASEMVVFSAVEGVVWWRGRVGPGSSCSLAYCWLSC